MGWSFRIGRIAGIDVFVHFTFVILLAWIGVSHYRAHNSVTEAISGLVFICTLFGIVCTSWATRWPRAGSALRLATSRCCPSAASPGWSECPTIHCKS